jgi:hypothetical protein
VTHQSFLTNTDMASAIAAMRKGNKGQSNQETTENDDILENLMIKLPPQEIWDAEYSLGVLILG